MYIGFSIRLMTDFFSETMEAKRQWDEIFKILKEKTVNPKLYIWANYSIRIEKKSRYF